MAESWYFQVNGRVNGPVTSGQIKSLADTGIVKHETLVRKGESGNWVEAWHVKGLLQPEKSKVDSDEEKALAFLGPASPSPIADYAPAQSQPVAPPPIAGNSPGRFRPVALQCPCGKRLVVNTDHVGSRLKCPACGESLIVRDTSSPQAQPLGSQVEDRPDGLSKTTLIVLWSGVGVISLGAILFVVWYSHASHAANVASAKQLITEAIANARQWIASNSQDSGETVERQLTKSLASELVTDKTEGEAMLKKVRQQQTQLAEMARTQGLQRKASAVLEKAKRQIDNKQCTEAITFLREYLADPYATNKPEAQRLLAETEIAVSDTLTMDSLVALNDTAFNRAKTNATIDDSKVIYPGLVTVRQETIQRNLDKATQRRQVLKVEEEKRREVERLAVIERQRQEEDRRAQEERLRQAETTQKREEQRIANLRSWDLILGEAELGGKIDREWSRDHDYGPGGGAIRFPIDNTLKTDSSHNIHVSISETEVWDIRIKVEVFTTSDAAKQRMEHMRQEHFTRYRKKSPDSDSLKNYPPDKSPQESIEENPFFSRQIEIKPFGDDSFCYQWSSFAPEIVFRVDRVVASVACSIDKTNQNINYGNDITFRRSLEIAGQQEAKIKKILRKHS